MRVSKDVSMTEIDKLRLKAIRDRDELKKDQRYYYIYSGNGIASPITFLQFGFALVSDQRNYGSKVEDDEQLIFSYRSNSEKPLVDWKFLSDAGVERSPQGYLGINFMVTEKDFVEVVDNA